VEDPENEHGKRAGRHAEVRHIRHRHNVVMG
jgi:hypothetical protein